MVIMLVNNVNMYYNLPSTYLLLTRPWAYAQAKFHTFRANHVCLSLVSFELLHIINFIDEQQERDRARPTGPSWAAPASSRHQQVHRCHILGVFIIITLLRLYMPESNLSVFIAKTCINQVNIINDLLVNMSLGAPDRFDMSGTFFKGLLEKIRYKPSFILIIFYCHSLIGDHQIHCLRQWGCFRV